MRMYQQITRKEAVERFGATYVWRLEASMQVFLGQRCEPVYRKLSRKLRPLGRR